MSRARILIGDDHTLVAEGLRRILENQFEVVGLAEDGLNLVYESRRLKPDVILVDISLPVLNGMAAARKIIEAQPRAKIIFLTMHSDSTYLWEAVRLGARGYVLKRSAVKELLDAVNQVLAGKTYISPELENLVLDSQHPPGVDKNQVPDLTDRQIQVFRLIATGQTDMQIAQELGISIRTVRFHRGEIKRKLGIKGTAALTRYAMMHNIV